MKRKLCAENGSPVMMKRVLAGSKLMPASRVGRVVAFCDSGFFMSDLECPREIVLIFERLCKALPNQDNNRSTARMSLARPSLFNRRELRLSKEESLWTIKRQNVRHRLLHSHS